MMIDYQRVSHKRTALCLASAAFFYAVGRYSKVENIGKATLPVALSAIAQGMQPKAHNKFGERTSKNYAINLLSLGLISYGMRQALLTTRTKVLAGVVLLGSQVAISHLFVETFLKGFVLEIAKLDDKHQSIEELYGIDSISINDKIYLLKGLAKFFHNSQKDELKELTKHCIDSLFRLHLELEDAALINEVALMALDLIEFSDSLNEINLDLFRLLDNVVNNDKLTEDIQQKVHIWKGAKGTQIRAIWEKKIADWKEAEREKNLQEIQSFNNGNPQSLTTEDYIKKIDLYLAFDYNGGDEFDSLYNSSKTFVLSSLENEKRAFALTCLIGTLSYNSQCEEKYDLDLFVEFEKALKIPNSEYKKYNEEWFSDYGADIKAKWTSKKQQKEAK